MKSIKNSDNPQTQRLQKQQKQIKFKSYKQKSQILKKHHQIIQLLQQKDKLQWFGKKKYLNNNKINNNKNNNKNKINTNDHKNNTNESVEKYLSTYISQIYQPKSNKSNKSQNIIFHKSHINSNSLYKQSYHYPQKVQKQPCLHPNNNLTCQQKTLSSEQLFNLNKNTVYTNSFKYYHNQPEKSCKRIEEHINLPFIGKTTYKNEFLQYKKVNKTSLIKPNDLIKTIDVSVNNNNNNNNNNNKNNNNNNNNNNNTKSNSLSHNTTFSNKKDNKKPSFTPRPVSPIRPTPNIIKHSSFNLAYQTLYNRSFNQNHINSNNYNNNNENNNDNNQLEFDFISKNKYGSLGKNRWGNMLNIIN